ncbi:PVC-type heme-binding CxxCH protein [Parapedobacter pyrenivorans]|nr:PVC-type heme-binding CxxCH protein [Parapedobacter pyrenivorans]
MLRNLYFLLLFLPMAAGSCRKAKIAPPGFELAPGFQIELVASEPLIVDPVAMVIDEYGRLYVVEMPGNPYDESGVGNVKLLADTNGDGRMDKHTVFADSLRMPSGITRWKKGLLVTDPPHVLYLADTDGDGRADVRDTVLAGFDDTNLEYNVNTPIVGLDNWVYLSNGYGSRLGDIHFPAHPDGPRLQGHAARNIVRFKPDARELEMCSGVTQFGQTFDEWGRHFLVNNSNHIYQEVLAARYLLRNPEMSVSGGIESLSDHGDAAEVFPIVENPDHQLLTDVGVFTSACGITAYVGGAFPSGFNEGMVFVAEPVHSLIHVDHLVDNGASFQAGRVHEEKEFLASTDPWFRPVNMYVGPDGALYVVDYYRQIIEGPQWLSEEVRESGDLYNGSDKGRIYRITASGTKPLDWSKNLQLGDASAEELVKMLAHPNGWWRQNAQRLLVDRNREGIGEVAVRNLVALTQSETASLGRLHALWTLEGLGQLDTEHIVKALQDPVAQIREHAIRLAELHLDQHPELVRVLLELRDDTDPKVRFQLLCTLGFLDTPQAGEARQQLLLGDVEDKWIQIAALSAPAAPKDVLLQTFLARFVPAYASLVERLSTMIAADGNPEATFHLIERATALSTGDGADWQVPVLEGLAAGLQNASQPPIQGSGQNLLIRAFLAHPADNVRLASLRVLQQTGIPLDAQTVRALDQAVSMAGDKSLADERRVGAIQFLALGNLAAYEVLLQNLVVSTEPLSVQRAALQLLGGIPGTGVSRYILDQWETLTPGLRGTAIATFMVYPFDESRINLLLDAIEAGKVQRTNLEWYQIVRLMRDTPDEVKKRARALLAENEGQRREIIQRYQAVLNLEGDPKKGQAVFQRSCATCHKLGENGEGIVYGPDLSTVRNWPVANLLEKILDPGRSIAQGYELWMLTLKSGDVKQGIMVAENTSGFTLRYPGGMEEVIGRADVDKAEALSVSAMPPGLEAQITEQEMADLLSYIRRGG